MTHQWKVSHGERYQTAIEAEVQRMIKLGRASGLREFKAADVGVTDFDGFSLVAVLEVDGRPLIYQGEGGLVFTHPYLITLVYRDLTLERGCSEGVSKTIREFMEGVFAKVAQVVDEHRRAAQLARPNLVDEW